MSTEVCKKNNNTGEDQKVEEGQRVGPYITGKGNRKRARGCELNRKVLKTIKTGEAVTEEGSKA